MENQAMPYSVPSSKKVNEEVEPLTERARKATEERARFLKESTIPAQDGFINLSE
jgi:mRNA-degrading endonuclease RelE of RelBE toxin-antitoxin system